MRILANFILVIIFASCSNDATRTSETIEVKPSFESVFTGNFNIDSNTVNYLNKEFANKELSLLIQEQTDNKFSFDTIDIQPDLYLFSVCVMGSNNITVEGKDYNQFENLVQNYFIQAYGDDFPIKKRSVSVTSGTFEVPEIVLELNLIVEESYDSSDWKKVQECISKYMNEIRKFRSQQALKLYGDMKDENKDNELLELVPATILLRINQNCTSQIEPSKKSPLDSTMFSD